MSAAGLVKKKNAVFSVEMWPLARIKPYAGNPRKRSKQAVGKVAASIKEFGWRQPIVVDEAGVVLVGHTRLDAAKALAQKQAPVHVAMGLSEQQKRAYRIADNRTNEETEWDEELLSFELKGLDGFDLTLTGFDEREWNALLRSGPVEGEDEVPEPGPAVTQRGDLWELGAHRVLCGDATSAEDVERVTDSAIIPWVITDPPYGIGIVKLSAGNSGRSKPFGEKGRLRGEGAYAFGGKNGRAADSGANLVDAREYYPIVGDDKPFNPMHLLGLGKNQVIFGANFFASRLPDGMAWIVWDKDATGNFSDCELAWTSRAGRLRLYRHVWSGLRREGPRAEELIERVHPTQKPVGLFRDILDDYTEPDSVLLDPYLGSGSTLIAAETESRRCFGLEIEPRYCDVIRARWEKFTGKTATLHRK